MSQKVRLVFEAEGDSFDAAQNNFVNMAAEIVMKRLMGGARVGGVAPVAPVAPAPAPMPAPTVESIAAAAPVAPVAQAPVKRKPGRPAGAPNKPKEENHAPAPVTIAEAPAPIAEEAVEAPAPEAPAPEAPAIVAPPEAIAAEAPATIADALEALKAINFHYNADKARECLTHFKVKRLAELTDENRGEFVSYCSQLVAAKK